MNPTKQTPMELIGGDFRAQRDGGSYGSRCVHALEPAVADDTPAKGSTPAMITAKPLPEKVFNTVDAGHQPQEHTRSTMNSKATSPANVSYEMGALGVPDATKANQTYSDLRELKVEYTFALGGVKNHELYFGHIGGKGGDPNGPIADALKGAFKLRSKTGKRI